MQHSTACTAQHSMTGYLADGSLGSGARHGPPSPMRARVPGLGVPLALRHIKKVRKNLMQGKDGQRQGKAAEENTDMVMQTEAEEAR